MKRTDKKGFTIVELVIVIAVIAILAAVLIPNISKLVRKANQSADIQLVRNMNTALQVESTGGATHYDTAHDAIVAAAKAGYDLTKIAVSDKENAIIWDAKNQCFAYLKSGSNELEYAPNTRANDEKTPAEQLWMVTSEVKSDAKYSIYWIGDGDATITGIGFDAGDRAVNVTYDGKGSGKTVVIRTNGGTLTVTRAASDTVNHYGAAETVALESVEAYNEYGTVSRSLTAKAGTVAVKDGAFVNKVVVPENASAKISMESDAIVRSIEAVPEDAIVKNPNGVKSVTEEEKNKVVAAIEKVLTEIFNVHNVAPAGEYKNESVYLDALKKQKENLGSFDLYYAVDYNGDAVQTLEVDGQTYNLNDDQRYSMGNNAILTAKVFKCQDGKLLINKITYITALANKRVLKVNGKILSLAEDSYDVDLEKALTITGVTLDDGNSGTVSPQSESVWNVAFKPGQTIGRVSVKVDKVNPGDIVLIRKNENGKISYSFDKYMENTSDFGVYPMGYKADKKPSTSEKTQISTYIVFDKTTGAYKGTFTIQLNCSVSAE